MPRSGWLATGAIAAALAATTPWLGQRWLANPAAWLLLWGSWIAVVARWRGGGPSSRRAGPLLPLVVTLAGAPLGGAPLVPLPLAAPAAVVDLPAGSGPWSATITAIGNPRDGQQVATV